MTRFTAAEAAMLASVAGGTSQLGQRLCDSRGKFIGAMNAVGYQTVSDGRVPDQLRGYVMADAVWEWLKDQPGLEKFKTKAREQAYKDAQDAYERITEKRFGPIEPPVVTQQTGNWNSENKLIMRTHPTPPASTQFGNVGNPQPEYANPNAPSDSVQETVPQAPTNLTATATSVAGQISLTWQPPLDATTFNVYRGTASGAETLLTGTNGQSGYVDATATSGTQFWYVVTAVNAVGESAKSNEASGIAK